jgi:hypothetical protein
MIKEILLKKKKKTKKKIEIDKTSNVTLNELLRIFLFSYKKRNFFHGKFSYFYGI